MYARINTCLTLCWGRGNLRLQLHLFIISLNERKCEKFGGGDGLSVHLVAVFPFSLPYYIYYSTSRQNMREIWEWKPSGNAFRWCFPLFRFLCLFISLNKEHGENSRLYLAGGCKLLNISPFSSPFLNALLYNLDLSRII